MKCWSYSEQLEPLNYLFLFRALDNTYCLGSGPNLQRELPALLSEYWRIFRKCDDDYEPLYGARWVSWWALLSWMLLCRTTTLSPGFAHVGKLGWLSCRQLLHRMEVLGDLWRYQFDQWMDFWTTSTDHMCLSSRHTLLSLILSAESRAARNIISLRVCEFLWRRKNIVSGKINKKFEFQILSAINTIFRSERYDNQVYREQLGQECADEDVPRSNSWVYMRRIPPRARVTTLVNGWKRSFTLNYVT